MVQQTETCACAETASACCGGSTMTNGVNTLAYDPSLCVNCGMCVMVCPHAVFAAPGEGDGRAVQLVRWEACMECGACQLNCPTGAIRPANVEGNKSVEIEDPQCMYCGNCYTVCPSVQINNAKHDGISIWVGGKVSNARTTPAFSKLAVPYLPNTPPRWTETVEAVRNILEVWATNARKHERMGEWIERIGWPQFFEKTGLPFTKYHIDNWRGSRKSLNSSTYIRF